MNVDVNFKWQSGAKWLSGCNGVCNCCGLFVLRPETIGDGVPQ